MSSTEPQPKPQRRPFLRIVCWSALLASVVLAACGGKAQQDAGSTAPAAGGMVGAGGSIGSGGASKGAATSAAGIGTGGSIGSGGATSGTPSTDADTADSGVGTCYNDALSAALGNFDGLVQNCMFTTGPMGPGPQLVGTILVDDEGRAVAASGSSGGFVAYLTAAGWSCPAAAGSTFQIWCFGGGD
jgi:hypothetical protein